MKHEDLRVAISHFLDLVVNGRGEESDNLNALVVSLDMLAWMQHVIHAPELGGIGLKDNDRPLADGPEREFRKMRAIVEQQFPSFGYYSTPANPADQNGQAEMIVGDAAADLANIACELFEVAWRFQNTDEDDALRAFSHGFQQRWRAPLRKLQWYIELRR